MTLPKHLGPIIRWKHHRARKSYRCQECGVGIAVGSKYCRFRSSIGGWIHRILCLACERQIREYQASHPGQEVPFGGASTMEARP